MKKRFSIVLLAVLAIIATLWAISPQPRRGSGASGSIDAPVETAADAGTATEAPTNVVHGEIRRGVPFYVAMTQVGVSAVDVERIVRACKKTFNFRTVKPGQVFAVYEGTTGEIDSLHFTIDNERLLKVRRAEQTYEARVDTVAYTVQHYVTSGVINSSIYNSLQANGASPELASHLAIIFQWDIDFFKDIREGDTYTILYEERTYPDGETQIGNVLAARVFTQGRECYAFAFRNADGVLNYFDATGKSLQKSLLRAPLRYSRISSNFTYKRRHPVTHTYKPHLGVDYVARVGTPVRSTGQGTVLVAGYARGNGNYVKIRHNSRYTTYYLHLKGFAKGIRKGRHVRQGQVIGYLGSTGLATAPHLDYRIKVDGRFVNPRTIRLPSKEPVPAEAMTRFEVTRDACLLRFFEAVDAGSTVQVLGPRPPLQQRMAPIF